MARESAEAAIERSLSAARELLGMQLAFVAEAARTSSASAPSTATPRRSGARRGRPHPAPRHALRPDAHRRVGNVVPDVAAVPAAAGATGSPGVGAYVGVPVSLADGSVYGSLCCVSAQPRPALRERDVHLLEVLARMIADQIDRERQQRRSARLEGEASAGQALLAALKARERYTAEHSEAVVELSTAVAEALGLTEDEIVQVSQVALLHDVGKLGVPEAILQKPGALNDAEWLILRAHPAMGERVVASIASLAHLAPAVRAEHERWDGGGYPDGLAGEHIPLASRICLACDAWHAMTSDRPYRAALPDARGARRAPAQRRHPVLPAHGRRRCSRCSTAAGRARTRHRRCRERHRAARVGAARADRRRRRGGRRAPARGRAGSRGRGDPPRGRRVVGLDQPLGARPPPRATLINVGSLGPGEERFPIDETYELADYPLAARLLREG